MAQVPVVARHLQGQGHLTPVIDVISVVSGVIMLMIVVVGPGEGQGRDLMGGGEADLVAEVGDLGQDQEHPHEEEIQGVPCLGVAAQDLIPGHAPEVHMKMGIE